MTGDRPVFGILLMLGFCVLAPLGDSIAKYLGGTIPLLQLLLVRFGLQAVLLMPYAAVKRIGMRMDRRLFRLTLLRTGLHIIGIGAMFSALRFLPLADAIAIVFVMPFILLLLGKYVLGEEVGRRRLMAVVVGFAGTLMVIQPSFAAVGWPALLPLTVAVVFALFMLVTRHIARDIDPIALQAVSGVMAVPVLAVLLLVPGEVGALTLVMPTATEMVLLFGIGALGTMAHLLLTWSLRYAPAATVAPMQYLEIPVATVIGWLVFRDLPNGLAGVGIALTVAAGLYVILRERSVSRAVA